MASDGERSTRQDWCDQNLSHTNQDKVGQENENFRDNGAHGGQAKEKLEEELTRLTLVMSENQCLLRNVLTDMQEADEELRLVLAIIKADLKKSSRESEFSGGVNKSEMKQEIMTNLTELVKGQEEIKSKLSDQSQIEDLTKIVEEMVLKQTDPERKPSFKCYWCYEEGHLKRNCPRRIDRGGIQSQVFRQHPQRINKGWPSQPFQQRMAYRHRHNVDGMHKGISMSWPVEGRDDIEGRNIGQSRRENVLVSHNPLN